MTRHRDQIAHIQRTGLNAGRKEATVQSHEDMAWDAYNEKLGDYMEARDRYVGDVCRCSHDASQHHVSKHDEVTCGKCDECYNADKRRRCAACGEWADADDVTGEACPSCGDVGEMEAAR